MGTSIRAHLAVAEWLAGSPERAMRTSDEALGIARGVRHPLSLAQALALGTVLRVLCREWAAAEALAAETRAVGARYHIPDYAAFADLAAGVATAARGDATGGAGLFREGMAGLRRTGWRCNVPLMLAGLAPALGAGGGADTAIETASEALQMVRAGGELAWEAEALRVLGEAKRTAGAADPAEVRRTCWPRSASRAGKARSGSSCAPPPR